MEKHNFNEKTEEYSAKDGKNIPVIVTPKYIETKNKVIGIIDSGIYKGLDDSCFWILMNRTKNGKMAYTGLIISHDGMKIINDNLPEETRVKPDCFSMPIISEYEKDCMWMYYTDLDTFEIGEISLKNCQNSYPYAMLLKRTFDRVVRNKAKLYGVYSESEADEFNKKEDTEVTDPTNVYELMKQLYTQDEINKLCTAYKLETIEKLDLAKAIKYVKDRSK